MLCSVFSDNANVFRASKRAFFPLVGTLEACVDSRQMVYGWGGSTARYNDETEVSSKSASQQASNEQSYYIHFKRNDFNMPTRGFSQSDCPCRAEPRTTRLLSVHTLSAYLLCHMKKISWQISIRVIIIYYDAKGQLSSIPNYCWQNQLSIKIKH